VEVRVKVRFLPERLDRHHEARHAVLAIEGRAQAAREGLEGGPGEQVEEGALAQEELAQRL